MEMPKLPLEQLATSAEERLQRGDGERLPEAARTRDEEELGARIRYETMHEHRLVDIDLAVSSQRRKIVRVCRYRSHRRILYQNMRRAEREKARWAVSSQGVPSLGRFAGAQTLGVA